MEIHRLHLETVSSTNSWARAHLSQFPQEALTVITAHHQTHGKGQRGRSWLAPPGASLTATFVQFHLRDPLQVLQLMFGALTELLRGYGLTPFTKLPNDILIENKKIAGILIEITPEACLAGVGLNVQLSQKQLEEIDQPATSLHALGLSSLSPCEVLDQLMLNLNRAFSAQKTPAT